MGHAGRNWLNSGRRLQEPDNIANLTRWKITCLELRIARLPEGRGYNSCRASIPACRNILPTIRIQFGTANRTNAKLGLREPDFP